MNGARWLAMVIVMLVAQGVRAERANGVFVEALGKGGLWGVGYDRRIQRQITVGAVASVGSLDGDRYASLSPYLGLYPVRGVRNAWFIDVGAQLAHVWTPSPVPEWPGQSSSGVGAMACTGYEMRDILLFRLFLEGVVGKGGVMPWVGLGVGYSF